MTHALSSIIDLTNAPAPPRWFEFLLEPGRLQQHLESNGCDPSPIQLISLFFRNIPNLETTSSIPPIHINLSASSASVSSSPPQSPSTTTTTTISDGNIGSFNQTKANNNNNNGANTVPPSPLTNGNAPQTSPSTNENGNPTVNNGNKIEAFNEQTKTSELTERVYNDYGDQYDVMIPPTSYEAKYRAKKTYALQTLAIKVASFLKWDLDILCRSLTIPIQCKLMQALLLACSSESCPPEVKKFASVIHCHWFLRSAIAYKLSTLEPQSNSTTIIYLSQLQQQQQTADTLALLSMGELFSESSKMLEKCASELLTFILDLTSNKDNSTKKFKGSNHPFKKAKLSRPKLDCFDSRGEQYNDWTQCEIIEPFEFIEAACYDLGRFFFFEESYPSAKQSFEWIKGSTSRFPLLENYLQSSTDILTTDDRPTDDDDDDMTQANSDCDKITNEIYNRRKRTERYLFDCMTQFRECQQKGETDIRIKVENDGEEERANEDEDDIMMPVFADTDLRYEQQKLQQRLPENSAWYLQMSDSQQQQQLLEIGKGDLYMSRGQFKQAMGCFVGSLMLMTDYFRVFSKNYVDEEPCISRMIQCSISLSCFTQAVALCQMTKSLNYTVAFKQLNERVCNDCCDDIYECIWNVTLLEYIINLHARRGEVDRRTKVIQLLGQLELNENNPEDILREAEHVRRGRFFRIISNKYL